MASQRNHRGCHLLIVTLASQGQINPARHLARRLTRTTNARVTIATPVSSHRLMFPSSTDALITDGPISYASYSDGYDDGYNPMTDDIHRYLTQLKLSGPETLTKLLLFLAGVEPVTCVVYTLVTDWAADVATSLGLPPLLYWTQPASVFALFYNYFCRGYAGRVRAEGKNPDFALNFPGLPLLRIKDLPSFMLDAESNDPLLLNYDDVMKSLTKQKNPKVIVNTFHTLEADAIGTVNEDLKLVPVGPMIESTTSETANDLFERDTNEYVKWLDDQKERSVVYVSFGSMSRFSTEQMEALSKGLRESGRPYLWVVRRDVREKESALVDEIIEEARNGGGMVIEWCEQLRVLSHSSVGCFVTHCGWNSMLESMVCGVPTVMLPRWVEQGVNAKLAEAAWGTGVRAEFDGGTIDLKRCFDVAMDEDGEIRKKTGFWRDKAVEAVGDDGPSVRSLLAFLEER